MTDSTPVANLSTDWDYLSHLKAWDWVIKNDAFNWKKTSWPTQVSKFPLKIMASPLLFITDFTGGYNEAQFLFGGTSQTLVQISLSPGSISVRTFEKIDSPRKNFLSLLQILHNLFPETIPEEKHEVWIKFWAMSKQGPTVYNRRISVPSWDDIRGNYLPSCTEWIDFATSTDYTPGFGGNLVLFHGMAGTGKTFVIRTLAWEWRKWCNIHYVTDPENFFGAESAYLLSVLLGTNDEEDEDDEGSPKWKLIVLEDTGELMSADAKVRVGQALSRLLNTVDGMLGQGLNILVLITTNEKVSSLHPAVIRPGRCSAELEFAKLPEAIADSWLKSNGLPTRGKTMTLAELYAEKGGYAHNKEDRSVGFIP